MKNIAIFCDGTWNSPTMPEPTSVFRVSQSCADDDKQVVIYMPGVGVGKLGSTIKTWVNKLAGGAFGWGLARNVKQAYAELCRVYEEGDKIYIFGFSRGAYTARSLAGMIRKCGIIPKEDIGVVKLARAWQVYKKAGKKNHPDGDIVWPIRQRLSPNVATSEKDLTRRIADGNEGGHIVNIAYLGVWDTVGALGIPEGLVGPLARLWNWRYKFHDTELSSLVKSARHAVALDEQRVFYEPSLWNNLTGPDGLNKGDISETRPYQQVWFIGSHSIVGGSSDSRGLVSYPLSFIADGARDVGLAIKETPKLPDHDGDALFETKELTDPGLVYAVAPHLRKWRKGPDDPGSVHWSVRERARRLAGVYQPDTVKLVLAALLADEMPAAANDDTTPVVRQA
ncbi:DUF2235 domain-containing protein [Yoonia sp. SS1-5]|uniref:DUF2235 domain-containing protein n=1 Tax=Yoonia rhodophyticola TaxID=3137370 RepID=A0AAN0M726_9RHOB